MLKRSENRNDCLHPPRSVETDDGRMEAPFSNYRTIKTSSPHAHTHTDKHQRRCDYVGG